MSFKNGEILGFDLMGEDYFFNEYYIEPNQILYLGNHLENKKLNQTEYLPLGFHAYNLMREKSAQDKIHDLQKSFAKKNSQIDLELLKGITNI